MAVTSIQKATLEQIAGDGIKFARVVAELSNATKLNATTGLTKCFSAQVSVRENAAGVAATSVLGLPAAADDGTVDVTAVGATGTTTVEIMAFGQ